MNSKSYSIFPIFIACIIFYMLFISGCSTLSNYGIGGEPRIACKVQDSIAILDDRLIGSDASHLSVIRRLQDADQLCKKVEPKNIMVW